MKMLHWHFFTVLHPQCQTQFQFFSEQESAGMATLSMSGFCVRFLASMMNGEHPRKVFLCRPKVVAIKTSGSNGEGVGISWPCVVEKTEYGCFGLKMLSPIRREIIPYPQTQNYSLRFSLLRNYVWHRVNGAG